MNYKRRIMVGGLSVVMLGGLAWLALRPHEPVYQGKRVGEYLDQLAKAFENNRNPTPGRAYVEVKADDPAVKAIYACGPNAIPFLRRALRKKDGQAEKTMALLRTKLPARLSKRLPSSKSAYLAGLRDAAIRGLAALGPTAKEALPDLIDCFSDSISRNMAIYAVTEIGPQSENLPALLTILKTSSDPGARACAAMCIGIVGLAHRDVLAALLQASRDKTPYVRASAIGALGGLGSNALAAVPMLTGFLQEPDRDLRINTAKALWKIQGDTNAWATSLTKELEDEIAHPTQTPGYMFEHQSMLLILSHYLTEAGPSARAAVPLLENELGGNETKIGLPAARALWQIARQTNGILPMCLSAIRNSDPNVRLAGAALMAEVCVETRLPLPPEEDGLLTEADSFVRFYIARATWKLSGQTERTLPILIEGLHDHFTYYRNTEIRRLAAETLGEMGTNALPAIPALVETLNDGQEVVRVAATNALNAIR
jgi:HEAT repeat protein